MSSLTLKRLKKKGKVAAHMASLAKNPRRPKRKGVPVLFQVRNVAQKKQTNIRACFPTLDTVSDEEDVGPSIDNHNISPVGVSDLGMINTRRICDNCHRQPGSSGENCNTLLILTSTPTESLYKKQALCLVNKDLVWHVENIWLCTEC